MKRELVCSKCSGRISDPESKQLQHCFLKEKGEKKLKKKLCPGCGGQKSTEYVKLCRACFIKQRKARAEAKKRTKIAGPEISCRHYWYIDSNNVGVCRVCGERKDFGELMRERQHAKAVKAGIMKSKAITMKRSR